MDYYINWGLCNLPTFKLPAVIATNGPKIRTRHSKLAQFGGKTAQLATLTGNIICHA